MSANLNQEWIAKTESEIQTLAESYKDLHNAKQKFKESQDAIRVQQKFEQGREILVPLTGSMYVPGQLIDTNKFLIDIGTQYLVEKDGEGAIDYFDRKMKFIDVQMGKFSELIQSRVQARSEKMKST